MADLFIGAFPLVIEAFQKLHKKRKSATNIEEEYSKTIDRVGCEQDVFRSCLERLLFLLYPDQNFSEDEIEELLAEPFGARWASFHAASLETTIAAHEGALSSYCQNAARKTVETSVGTRERQPATAGRSSS